MDFWRRDITLAQNSSISLLNASWADLIE